MTKADGRTIRAALAALALLSGALGSAPAQAQAPAGGGGGGEMRGLSIATGVMALTNSTKQGGQGSQGNTILTQTDVTWHGGWWGAGLYVQYDKQGANETDLSVGPRLELTWMPFYFELGYAAKMNRSFTDRAIAEQEGKGLTLGVGARFALGASTFLQFSYKYRTVTVQTQDGKDLDEPITQIDGYPLCGVGVRF
jgi:hypothetical protein